MALCPRCRAAWPIPSVCRGRDGLLSAIRARSEHNNFYLQSYVEQGAVVFSTYSRSFTVTPFVGLGMTLDTKGYEWNNKVQPRLGVKS